MPTLEEICERCIAVCQVPKEVPERAVINHVQSRFQCGRILDTSTDKVDGIESSKQFTRLVLLCSTTADVDCLCDEVKEEEIQIEDQHFIVKYQRAIPCELPDGWESIQISELDENQPGSSPGATDVSQQPHVGPKSHPGRQEQQKPTGKDQQQIHPNAWPIGPYGPMLPGYYQNIPPHMPVYGQGQGQTPMQGNEQGRTRGFPEHGHGPGHGPPHGPQQAGHPNQNFAFGHGQISPGFPMFGMPPNFKPDQQNVQGGQNMQFAPGMPMHMPMFYDPQTGQMIPYPGPGFPGLPQQQAQGRGEPRRPHPQQASGPPPPYYSGEFRGQGHSTDVKSPTDKTDTGLLGFNPYHMYIYKKAIRQGTEKDRTIRVNIVGNYGQGKTSLTRRLIGKSCQGIESTNGIEINRYRCTPSGNGKTKLTLLEDESQYFINRLASIARSIPIKPLKPSSDRASSSATTMESAPPSNALSVGDVLKVEKHGNEKSESASQLSKQLFENNKTRKTSTSSESFGDKCKTDTSTNDRISVKVPTISREEFKSFEAEVDEGNDRVDVLLDFWDFGGQYTFYATHMLFHSRKALYLLVFDLSSPLDKTIKDEEFPCEADERNMEYYARFWMESIHFLLGPGPQVILIGTHKDKLDGDERAKAAAKDEYFHQVRSLFDNTDLIYHIQPEDFAVSNHDSSDADFDEILKVILQKGLAIVNTSEIPGRWVALENCLKQEKHRKIIQFSRVREMNEDSECPLRDDDELKLFLSYHHEKGTLFYFDEEPIRNHVVLDPRYVVDAFKCIITTPMYRLKDPSIRTAWQSLTKEGKLTNVLIEKVWAGDFLQHKSVLLAFLSKHLILSQVAEYDETSGGCAEKEWYIIPSLLKDYTVQRDNTLSEFLDGKPQTQICYIMHFEEPTIVQIIYHRLLAAALGKWPVLCCGRKRLLYKNLGVLKLKGNYAGVMEMRDSGIELQVCNISGKQVCSQESDSFRRFAESIVTYEFRKLKYHADDKSKPFLRKYRCNHTFHNGEGSQNIDDVDQLKETDAVFCPDCICHKECCCTKAYAEWFLEKNADTIFPKIELSHQTLGIIAQTAIGRNWEFLGFALKLKPAAIDHIKADNDSDAMRIFTMLCKWKDEDSDNATLNALANAMTICPNVFVDWDEMRNIKESITGSSSRACTGTSTDHSVAALAESSVDYSDDQEALKFVRQLEDQQVEVTPYTVHFECELSKSVPVQWFFNSRQISPSDKYIIRNNGCIHSLEIKDVSDRDEGKYCATAEQETSEASIVVQDTEEEKRLLRLARQQEVERKEDGQKHNGMDEAQGDRSEEPERQTKIVVSNLPSVVHKEYLEMFFENKKKFGGSTTVFHVDFDEETSTAIVEFDEEEAVDIVLNKCPIKMMGQEVEVAVYKPEPPVPLCTIEVSGPCSIVCEEQLEILEMYFESERQSGGGDIVDSKFDSERNMALITFESEEVAQRVEERGNHVVNKGTLTVRVHTPTKQSKKSDKREEKEETVEDKPEPSRTIKVKGVDKAASRETVEFYFENLRRSGGGEIEEIKSDEEEEDVIYITFKKTQDAKNVVNKIGGHKVGGKVLSVSLYVPPIPPPSYENKILIKGLNPHTTMDCLFNFIEAKSGFLPDTMDYHAYQEGVVMVTFTDNIDFNELAKVFARFRLEGASLKVYPVPISNCIIVDNLASNVTEDTVEFYFENTRKSGGGPVNKVVKNEDDTFLVYFADYTIIDKILQRKHELSKQRLDVKRYQECLGRPEGEVCEKKLNLPDPVKLKDVNPQKLSFLKRSKPIHEALEKQMESCYTRVIWPTDGVDVTLECTLTKDVKDCSKLVKTWKKEAEKSFDDFLNTIAVHKISVLQDTWEKVIEHLKKISVPRPEAVSVFVYRNEGLITVVGNKSCVVSLAKIVYEILHKVI